VAKNCSHPANVMKILKLKGDEEIINENSRNCLLFYFTFILYLHLLASSYSHMFVRIWEHLSNHNRKYRHWKATFSDKSRLFGPKSENKKKIKGTAKCFNENNYLLFYLLFVLCLHLLAFSYVCMQRRASAH
jgi:ABC-type long-subunit fatty acid transport system fused permease/ATPase subunit